MKEILHRIQSKFFLYFYVVQMKILGLMPWSLKLSTLTDDEFWKHSKNTKCYFSTRGSAYNMILVCVYFMCIGIVLRDWFASDSISYERAKLVSAVRTYSMIFQALSVIIIWMIYVFRQHTMINFTKELENIDVILNNSNDSYFLNNIRIYIIFLGNFCSIIINLISALLIWPYPVLCCWTIPSIINSEIMIQFFVLVNSIHLRFQSINQKILKIGNMSQQFDLEFDHNQQSIISLIFNIKYAHIKLFNISNEIIDFYAIPLLISSINYIFTIMFGMYFLYSKYCISMVNNTYFEKFIDTTWIHVVLFPLTVLICSVNRITREIKKTSESVHKALNIYTVAHDIKKELVEFSGELLHQKLEFGAYKIISFNGSLLPSVLGSMTYLIILIQFLQKKNT